eukprot:2301549-Alexandrium_andersonii.AAC.1
MRLPRRRATRRRAPWPVTRHTPAARCHPAPCEAEARVRGAHRYCDRRPAAPAFRPPRGSRSGGSSGEPHKGPPAATVPSPRPPSDSWPGGPSCWQARGHPAAATPPTCATRATAVSYTHLTLPTICSV